MSFDASSQIKLKINQILEIAKRLREENLKLKERVWEQEQVLKQKEAELLENKRKFEMLSKIERENKQFKMDKEALQNMIDRMIENLEGF